MTKSELIEELVSYGEDRDDLKELSYSELKALYNDITDTSSMHPNETYDEFMEHEDFE